jgi:ATP-dependent DNA helicase RecG
LLAVARDEARVILSRNPKLEGEQGDALRLLLHLFSREDAIRMVRAG